METEIDSTFTPIEEFKSQINTDSKNIKSLKYKLQNETEIIYETNTKI